MPSGYCFVAVPESGPEFCADEVEPGEELGGGHFGDGGFGWWGGICVCVGGGGG